MGVILQFCVWFERDQAGRELARAVVRAYQAVERNSRRKRNRRVFSPAGSSFQNGRAAMIPADGARA